MATQHGSRGGFGPGDYRWGRPTPGISPTVKAGELTAQAAARPPNGMTVPPPPDHRCGPYESCQWGTWCSVCRGPMVGTWTAGLLGGRDR